MMDIIVNQERLGFEMVEVCGKDNCVNKYSWCGCPEL